MTLPLVIAHRGASRIAPENSLAAFSAAIDAGADMAELDVRRTLDGEYIVVHDPTFRGIPIDHWPYPDLVMATSRRFRWLGPTPSRPPRLVEVLELCAGRIGLDIELKETGYEAEIVDLALGRLALPDLLFSSFRDSAVAAVKRHRPDARAGLLLSPVRRRPAVRGQLANFLPFSRLRRCRADLVMPYQLMATEAFLTRAADHGFPVVVFTVNRSRRIRHFLRDPGIAGVITDDPSLALRLRLRFRAT